MSNYYVIFGSFGATLLAIFAALFYKNKAVESAEKVVMSTTSAEDAPLTAQQTKDEQQIKQVDAGLQQMIDERAKLRQQYLTDQQKADTWNTSQKPS